MRHTKLKTVNGGNGYIKEGGAGDRIFIFFTYLLTGLFALFSFYPFWYVLIYSLSDPDRVIYGLTFYPKGVTLEHYRVVLGMSRVYNAVIVSALRAVLGTVITLFFSSMFAYVLTKAVKGFKLIYRVMITTMYVSAGLIPYVLTMTAYGLKNNFLLYIIPGAVSAYFVILIKTYIESMPASLEESAHIDGANYFQIYHRIIMPLSFPVLAAVGVFSAVGQWNAWTDNLYLVKDPKLQTLQFILLDILRQSEALSKAFQQEHNYEMIKNIRISPMSIRMTVTIVSVVPVFIVYPFLQRFFIKGIMLGAVKG